MTTLTPPRGESYPISYEKEILVIMFDKYIIHFLKIVITLRKFTNLKNTLSLRYQVTSLGGIGLNLDTQVKLIVEP